VKQDTRIGQILADLGCVTPETVEAAAAADPSRPLRLVSRLALEDRAPEADLVRGLAVQRGVPGVDLSGSRLDLEAVTVVPKEVARESGFLPLRRDEGRLHVAFVDPGDAALLDELRFVTGADVVPYVAVQARLEAALEAAHAAQESGARIFDVSGGAAESVHLEVIVPPGTAEPADEDEEEFFSIPVDLEDEPLDFAVDETAGPTGRRVLIVDDEPEICSLLATALQKAGYRVATANRGLEALEKVKSFEPELVVLDAMLPEVHGFEICRKIRNSRRFGHVPVVMISAVYRGWRFALDVKDVYGATDFIEKPFRLVEVIERVKAALDGAEAAPEASAEAREKATMAYRRGVGMLKVGKVDGAIAAFRDGLDADPFAGNLHFSLGRALQLKSDVYGAITAYERAVELKPELFPALRSLAGLYEGKGFRRKAIETWERALPVAPDAETRTHARERLLSLIEGGATVADTEVDGDQARS
jgi:CheY-like chemotaxis protein